jgi:hypothetical protein
MTAFFNGIRTIGQFIRVVFKNKKQMKIVNLVNLANGQGINTVLNIIEDKVNKTKLL